jgi:hypothetical protein
MLEWLKIVRGCRPRAFLNQTSKLVLDAFKRHLIDSVKMKTELVVIPGGITSVLQPMDVSINHLTPNVHFSGRNTPLTYRYCIFFIYSTDVRSEYFKHAAHSPFFPLQNAVYFIMLPFLVSVLFTF